MNIFLKWLQVRPARRVALHPTRSLELPGPLEDVFARCIEGIERVLGGVVRESDLTCGTIDATFGLMFSERLTCSLERLGAGETRVRIESRRGAVGEPKMQSDYVDRLADWLATQ